MFKVPLHTHTNAHTFVYLYKYTCTYSTLLFLKKKIPSSWDEPHILPNRVKFEILYRRVKHLELLLIITQV